MSSPTPLSAPAVARLRPLACGLPWGILVSLLALFPLLPPPWWQRVQFYPFALSLALLGLPHGAMDHRVVGLQTGRTPTCVARVGFVAGYLALVVVVLALWRLAPGPSLGLFLLISWLHWGQGDDWAGVVFGGRRPRSFGAHTVLWAVRGALPIVLPVLAHPGVLAQTAAGVLGWYGGRASGWALGPEVRYVGLWVLAALVAAEWAVAWRETGPGRRRAFWQAVGETALLATFFWVVPPILAVGVYFSVWHGARHIARLMLLDGATVGLLERGRFGAALTRTAWQSLPMTAAALGMLAGLYVLLSERAASLAAVVYLSLSLIAALTVPHFLLVLWMDQADRRDARQA